MTQEEFDLLENALINEGGFEYCFVDYSDFDKIKDPVFHNLRKEYLTTREKLDRYIGSEKTRLNLL